MDHGERHLTGNDAIPDEGSQLNENSHLSPKEAFHKFDTDQSGTIEEDEFFYLLDCVGIKAECEYQERMFKKYVKKGSDCIDYEGFRKAWLLLGNPKQELADRGIHNLPKFATRYQLVGTLEKVLDEEERLEALAKAEAERWKKLQDRTSLRTEYIRKAKTQAGLELGAALDAGGCCYVLGAGANGQFSQKPKKDMSTSSFRQVGFDVLQSLWDERIQGMVPENINPPNNNTTGIWGRKPTKVALTDNTIFALTDCGIMSWGGNDHWWHELSSDASTRKNITTPRSSALLMNDERVHRNHLAIIQEEMAEKEAHSAHEAEQMKRVLKYFGKLPFDLIETEDITIISELLELISYDQLLRSLHLRGKPCESKGFTKLELLSLLSADIHLEIEMLGEEGHQELRGLETEVDDLEKRGKKKAANHLALQISETWAVLRVVQKNLATEAEETKEESRHNIRTKLETDFERWNDHRIEIENASLKQRDIIAMAITTRGNDIQTPRGVSQQKDIACGSYHSAIILEEGNRGKLYCWGVGSLGRLGLSKHVFTDFNRPQHVDEFRGLSIANVSCGQSHSAAVSSDGQLFLWGGSSSSQLGFGQFPDGQEYCCPIPTRLTIPSCKGIMRVSCGSSHTACIGRSGELFVWGCGDGGRIGLGLRMGTVHTPVLVESLRHENIVEVSCGCYQTMALTAIENVGANHPRGVKSLAGGRLYVAGPNTVLGTSFPSFGQFQSLEQDEVIIKHISAGYSHQSFVSESGELFCWGSNVYGCCGQHENIKFIPEPSKVEWIYKPPINLALGKFCHQSSYYMDSGGLSSCNGVDGNVDGNDVSALVHTQFESNPYWDLDLGSFKHITSIRLWNRCDEPDDMASPPDMFTRRLFPCWIIVSQSPFPKTEGRESLNASLHQSNAKIRISTNKRLNCWDVPKYTFGRYIRIQLEDTNFLHFSQVEVFGNERPGHGPVSSCASGKFVTAAVVGGIDDATGIETAYKRAVSADWYNAEILRQFNSYCDEYRKLKFQPVHKEKCMLCVGNDKCDICALKSKFRDELILFEGERSFRLDDIATHLLSDNNIEDGSNGIIQDGDRNHVGITSRRARSILPDMTKIKQRLSFLRNKKKASPEF